jgi:hypothetical protein
LFILHLIEAINKPTLLKGSTVSMINPIMRKKLNKFMWVSVAFVVAALLAWLWVAQASASRGKASFESYAAELNKSYTEVYANYDKEGDGKTTVAYVDEHGQTNTVMCTCDVWSYFLFWQRSCEEYTAVKMNQGTAAKVPPAK